MGLLACYRKGWLGRQLVMLLDWGCVMRIRGYLAIRQWYPYCLDPEVRTVFFRYVFVLEYGSRLDK